LLDGTFSVADLSATLPILCANLEPLDDDLTRPPGSLIIERDGVKLGLVAVINEEIHGLEELLAELRYRVTPWRSALEDELEALEAAGCDIVVLLSHLGVQDEVYAARDYAERLDLIVGGHSGLFQRRPDTTEGAPIIWPGRLGRYLGVVTLSRSAENLGEIVSYEALPVDRSPGRGAAVLERLRAYEEQRYRDWLEAYYVATAQPQFFGPDDCGACHTAELEQWRDTDHAHAFATLVEEGDERNLECVGCHTTGFGKPGGFADAERTPQLTDVGCQACHRAGPEHPYESREVEPVAAPVCAKCHRPGRDDDFSYSRDVAYVEH